MVQGTGIHAIAEMYPNCTIHGIDFSVLMYKRASRFNKSLIDEGKVLLQHGDFLKMPVPNNDYDKIFCLNVTYFWNELREPFAKVLSLLKQGGSFHIYMTDKDTLVKMKAPDSVFNKYSIDEVEEALKSVGFKDIGHHSEKGYYIKAKK